VALYQEGQDGAMASALWAVIRAIVQRHRRSGSDGFLGGIAKIP
jgi:hypothetical protein